MLCRGIGSETAVDNFRSEHGNIQEASLFTGTEHLRVGLGFLYFYVLREVGIQNNQTKPVRANLLPHLGFSY